MRLSTVLFATTAVAALGLGLITAATAQENDAAVDPNATLYEALQSDSDARMPDDARMRALIIDTLVANPDILVEALTRINAEQAEIKAEMEAREDRIRDIAANAIGAPVVGNPDGDVTIVAFTDYNCPHCRTAHDVLQKVVEEDGNIRLVHRELPMLGPDSLLAAKAALAADAQGKYDAFHDGLMSMDVPADTQSLLNIALQAGVDINAMLVAQDDEKVIAHIDDSKAIAEEFEILGTPTFFIGTTVASGAPTESDLEAAIAAERERQQGETP